MTRWIKVLRRCSDQPLGVSANLVARTPGEPPTTQTLALIHRTQPIMSQPHGQINEFGNSFWGILPGVGGGGPGVQYTSPASFPNPQWK